MRSHRFLPLAVVIAGLLLAGNAALSLASPASGVTPAVLNRATFDAFKVMSYPESGGLVKLEAKSAVDVVVRQHSYAAGGSTGWHAHPYPVLITVKEGTLTFYEYDDPTCTPIVVTAGHGYVDSGKGHIARNETDVPALDISVIFAPVGVAFRTELDAPGPYCGF
ncbi:MAG: cupin domain-containing protein [Candidatus Limnocylindrales bacterium]